MSRRRELAMDALTRALKLRARLGISLTAAVSPIDIAEKIGVEVRFVDLPSMEGIYVAGAQPQILLSSLRPQGRKMFTCAHELGHHTYGHGNKFDEIREKKCHKGPFDDEEYLADCFAAYLLMPKATIDNALHVRQLSCAALQPAEVYSVSSWLGVGYHTLVTHLAVGLGLISKAKAEELRAVDPQEIRRAFLQGLPSRHLHIVDANWVGRCIDCEVNDYLLLPDKFQHEGKGLARCSSSILHAAQPGVDRVSFEEWAAYVRIAPQDFVGRSCFRFEEVCDETGIC